MLPSYGRLEIQKYFVMLWITRLCMDASFFIRFDEQRIVWACNARALLHQLFKQRQMISQKKQANQRSRGRTFALLLLMFEVGIMFAYGYASYFPNYTASTPQNDYSSNIILYTFTALLAILGYGLLIAYSDNSAVAGLTTTLIVVAISVQSAPLLLRFWTSVFNGFSQNAELSLASERVTMVLCTSLLTSLTALVGRLGKLETLMVVLIYNIGWTFSYELTQYLQTKNAASSLNLYDDYGTNYVYVFAGFFALVTSLVLNCRPGKLSTTGSRHSAFVALIGTGFIFACFPFTGVLYPTVNALRNLEGPLSIYFALTASVICTYISSAIFGGLKVGVRESLLGVISGGVTISVVAGSINNIGACIAIGAFSGFFSGFWLRVVHPRVNRTSSVDHLGIFGPILVSSVLGGLVLSPVMYKSYMNLDTVSSGLGGKVTDSNLLYYQLVFIGIAAGTAIVAGLLAGLLSMPFRNSETDFLFTKLVSSDFGLYKEEEGEGEQDEDPAAQPQNNETNNALKNHPM